MSITRVVRIRLSLLFWMAFALALNAVASDPAEARARRHARHFQSCGMELSYRPYTYYDDWFYQSPRHRRWRDRYWYTYQSDWYPRQRYRHHRHWHHRHWHYGHRHHRHWAPHHRYRHAHHRYRHHHPRHGYQARAPRHIHHKRHAMHRRTHCRTIMVEVSRGEWKPTRRCR